MLSKLERSQYSTVVRPNVPEIKLRSRLSLYLGDEGGARAIEMLSKLALRKPNLDNCGHRHSCLCFGKLHRLILITRMQAEPIGIAHHPLTSSSFA
jgi:hypothetical protein